MLRSSAMKRAILAIMILPAVAANSGCDDETKVKRVNINPSEMELQIGESRQIEVIVEPLSAAMHHSTVWHSSDAGVAQVDNNGNVTAIYAGKCVVTSTRQHNAAICHVTVTTPTYNLVLPNAMIFNEGVESTSNANRLTIRLYTNGLAIDPTGNISGKGTFLNLAVYAPISPEVLPTGQYQTATTTGSEFSIAPGQLSTEGNNDYATGSFLGEYTDNGLEVLFIDRGSMTVEYDGSYIVKCSFECRRNEHIDASYQGTPEYCDTSDNDTVRHIHYTNAETKNLNVSNEHNTKHIGITFTTGSDTIITLTARIPLSAVSMPTGVYTTSEICRAYTLTHAESLSPGYIVSMPDSTVITSARLSVSANAANDNTYSATIVTALNERYILSPVANMPSFNINSISKLPITVSQTEK